jgi:general transcriptional corepressor TUP1
MISGSGDKTLQVFDMVDHTSKVLVIDSVDVGADVTSVDISPNGRFVAAGSLDTVVRIWDMQTGTLVERFKGHADGIYSVAFTPDGQGLISGSLDKTLKYWDVGVLISGKASTDESKLDRPETMSEPTQGSEDEANSCVMSFTGHKVCG